MSECRTCAGGGKGRRIRNDVVSGGVARMVTPGRVGVSMNYNAMTNEDDAWGICLAAMAAKDAEEGRE